MCVRTDMYMFNSKRIVHVGSTIYMYMLQKLIN